MNCPTCNKPTPPDSVHTCSPVPLLTAAQAMEWMYDDDCGAPNQMFTNALEAIATGCVACYDTATHKAVPLMTEAEAKEKWRGTMLPSLSPADSIKSGYQHFQGYLAALRDLGVIR